jgi:periplasmic protein TonB
MLSRVKSCPVCNRTYTDEALNFCLADGAFLSAPNDPQPTVASPPPRGTEAPTKALPAEQIPHTVAAEPGRSILPWLIAGVLAAAFVVYLALPKGSTSGNSNTATRDTPAPQIAEETKGGEEAFSENEVTVRARILSQPEPEYTEEARKNQASGTVVLRVVLSSSGEVTDIRVVSGLPYGLTGKAVEAARQIKFTPATMSGRAVSQSTQIRYNFTRP